MIRGLIIALILIIVEITFLNCAIKGKCPPTRLSFHADNKDCHDVWVCFDGLPYKLPAECTPCCFNESISVSIF